MVGEDWRANYLKNPLIKLVVVFIGVLGGYLVLAQFYNTLPFSASNPASLEMGLKIVAMISLLSLVGIVILLMERKK